MLTLRRPEIEAMERIAAPGVRALQAALARSAKAFHVNAPMDVVDWIHDHVEMSPSMTDRPGPFRLDPIQQALVRDMTEPGTERGALGKVPRMGMSTVWCAVLLYYACHEGLDVIYTERTDDAAQTFFKSILLPMLEGSPKIAGLRRQVRDGARQDTWRDTYLTNGATIQIRSVTGDGFGRQIKSGFSFADEAGSKEYQPGRAGSEGDKLTLLERRGQQYRHPHLIASSTPTEEGSCIITREFRRGDQRVWDMPCPHCGAFQPFLARVGNKPGPGLKYELDPVTGKVASYVDVRGDVMPNVWYECADCEAPIREEHKVGMIAGGHFRPTATPAKPGLRSWHVWAAHSSDPQSTWAHICNDHVDSLTDPALRQTFHNLRLALAWERQAHRTVPVSELQARAEAYPAPCPSGVRIITWGNDNQRGREDGSKPARGEVVVKGWGYGYECWILGHFVIPEVPFSPEWATELYRIHDMEWITADGRRLKAAAGGVDCGYNWDLGIQFCHMPESKRRRIRALKGDNTRVAKPTVGKISSSEANPLWSWLVVNKQTATEQLNDSLKVATAGPMRIHFPKSTTAEFLEQLTAYRLMRDKTKGTSWWQKDKDDSEVYDCWCYGYAVLRRIIIELPAYRPLIMLPPIGSMESGTAGATPYLGPDRSANSAIGVEAAPRPAPAAASPPVSTGPVPTQPRPDSGAEIVRGTRPPPRAPQGQQARNWGRVAPGRGGGLGLW